jgi:hypothetical protein
MFAKKKYTQEDIDISKNITNIITKDDSHKLPTNQKFCVYTAVTPPHQVIEKKLMMDFLTFVNETSKNAIDAHNRKSIVAQYLENIVNKKDIMKSTEKFLNYFIAFKSNSYNAKILDNNFKKNNDNISTTQLFKIYKCFATEEKARAYVKKMEKRVVKYHPPIFIAAMGIFQLFDPRCEHTDVKNENMITETEQNVDRIVQGNIFNTINIIKQHVERKKIARRKNIKDKWEQDIRENEKNNEEKKVPFPKELDDYGIDGLDKLELEYDDFINDKENEVNLSINDGNEIDESCKEYILQELNDGNPEINKNILKQLKIDTEENLKKIKLNKEKYKKEKEELGESFKIIQDKDEK